MKYNTAEEVHLAWERLRALLRTDFVENLRSHLVGSCGVNQQGNDLDVVLYPETVAAAVTVIQKLEDTGFVACEDAGVNYDCIDDFVSFRLITDTDNFNVILVLKGLEYKKWVLADQICRQVRATERSKRVAIYQTVFSGLTDGAF